MKKTNKILAKALVVILSLVLITSCVVSSTFAKYVVTKSASTTVSLQKFGLTVTLDPISRLQNQSNIEKKGDSITYTLNNVTLTPDDQTYKQALTASVVGTATVDANINITVTITANDAPFTISSGNFNKLSSDKLGVYNPITFYVGNTSAENSVYTPMATGTNVLKTNVENALRTKIAANAGGATVGNDGVITQSIDVDTNPTVNYTDLGVGFVWETPADANSTNLYNEISTWISNQTNPAATFTISYTISVEQAN